MGERNVPEITEEDIRRCGRWSLAAYLGPLFLLTLLARKDSPLARYHANQGFVLFLFELVFALLLWLGNLVFAGNVTALAGLAIFRGLGTLFILMFIVWGFSNAIRGLAVPLPLIGDISLLR